MGVFGSDQAQKSLFEDSIAKKSEIEGIVVYHRAESGARYSFLDDRQFPEKIQGYSRIASLVDYALYLYPSGGKLTAPDGELAILINSFGLDGSIELIDGSASAQAIQTSFKGLTLSRFPVEERSIKSSILDFSRIRASTSFPSTGTLIYIDRAFGVKGVGVVVLGFILSGEVRVHDRLSLIPSTSGEKFAEVKGIQISDEDYDSSGRGIRIGLSLKGVEVKDLAKTSWLDDSSFKLSNKIQIDYAQTPFYKQPVFERDLHLQCPGHLILSKISRGESANTLVAELASEVPSWSGMKVSLIDLNGKALRVAGGGTVSV